MKFKHSKEFSIGLSVIIALVILYVGIEYLKGNNIFKASNYYYVTYDNVAGLSQSAPVNLNGFKVGLVREIEYEYNNPGHIKVELSLNKELRLPKGTRAVFVTDMLGTSSIDLRLGSGNEYHSIGDSLIAGQSTGLMDAVTDNILPAVGQIIPKIDSLVSSLNTLVSDPALKMSMNHLQVAMANIEASSKRLNEVMTTMPALAGDARIVMGNVKEMSASLNTIATDLTTVSGELKEMPLTATMENVYQVSDNLKKLIGQLDSPDSSLGLLLKDPTLYKNLTGASASLDSLLIDVKKNPKRYINIKLL